MNRCNSLINAFRKQKKAKNLPKASETSFSVISHLNAAKQRVNRLNQIAPKGTIQKEVLDFVRSKLVISLERITDDIVRVGVFNIVFEDGYLQYDEQTGNVTELQRQPEQGKYTNST